MLEGKEFPAQAVIPAAKGAAQRWPAVHFVCRVRANRKRRNNMTTITYGTLTIFRT
jgi:hypothetical protein